MPESSDHEYSIYPLIIYADNLVGMGKHWRYLGLNLQMKRGL